MAECPECGAAVGNEAEFCPSCGTPMDTHTHVRSSRQSAGDEKFRFYIGAVLDVIAVVFLPFVFVFIALFEAISALFGGSLQNTLPPAGRDNAAVSGSFLIFRWFGNFLLLLLVVAVVAVVVWL